MALAVVKEMPILTLERSIGTDGAEESSCDDILFAW